MYDHVSFGHTDKEKEDMILSGRVHLVSLNINRHKLKNKNYGDGAVIGEFCTIDWPLYRKDPSACKLFHAIAFTNEFCHSKYLSFTI